MMVIKKIYNNNIILVEDEKQKEMILLGRGLHLAKKLESRYGVKMRKKDLSLIPRSLLPDFQNL